MQGKNIVLYSRMLVFARGKGYLLYESLGCRPTKKKKDRNPEDCSELVTQEEI